MCWCECSVGRLLDSYDSFMWVGVTIVGRVAGSVVGRPGGGVVDGVVFMDGLTFGGPDWCVIPLC